MPRAPVLLAAALVPAFLLISCEPGPGKAAAPTPPRAPSATRPPSLRTPADAILSDQAVGSRRIASRDHLSAAEAARQQPDQVGALQEYTAWSWLDASTRSWEGVSDLVLLTARPEGAARAVAFWSAEAARAPFLIAPCPSSVGRLDECRLAVSGDRAVVVGRLDALAFRLECPAAAAVRLASAQAAALTR